MGTNYYWNIDGGLDQKIKLINGKTIELKIDLMDPSIHIGKRSSAGLYCFKCQKTLCLDGNNGIHHSKSKWRDICPICGAKKGDEIIGTICSFTWAQNISQVKKICKKNLNNVIVVDEYESKFTGEQFIKIVSDCPIHFDEIDQWFS